MAPTEEINDSPENGRDVQVMEMDLTTTEEAESEEEVCAIEPPKTLVKLKLPKQQQEETQDNLAKLFDKILLAELTTEDTWMGRLRRVIERGDKQGFEVMGPYTNPLWSQMAVQDDCILVNNRYKQGFELMGPYTNPLWSQMAVQDDCILVNNRLAVPVQPRQAVLKRIHRGHPGQEAMLRVSQYLWWPHMNSDIVNLAEECRSCTRCGKNVKLLISKNASKSLPLLTQPGQKKQLDYGPIENQKGKKNLPLSSYR